MELARNVLNFLFTLLEVILIFNLLIVVHETGHFLAARWRGLVIEKFGIWFGKPLWKKTINGVQYSLGSLPFGGFVALPQMAPMDVAEGTPLSDRASLPSVSPVDKIIVALAGPVFSLGLALLFAVLVWIVGNPVSERETNLTIGYVVPDSPAAKATCTTLGVANGLRPGDVIEDVDSHPVSRFGGMNGSVVWYVARSEGDTIPFQVKRGDRTLTFLPKPLTEEGTSSWRRKSLRQVLIDPAYTSIVAKVEKDSPAAKAGLQEKDVVTEVNGQRLYNPQMLADTEQDSYGKSIVLTVERGRQTRQITLPAMQFEIGEPVSASPADRAGLKKEDLITAINGVAPTRFSELKETIAKSPGKPIELTVVSKDGKTRQVAVTPLVPKSMPDAMIGIGPNYEGDGITFTDGGVMKLAHEKPLDQVKGSVTSIVNTIGAVVAPHSKIRLQHLGGPVFIGRTYYYLLSSPDGWRLALWFSVVLNVNLAMLNMLPIPVLDGGHILLALIEMVRRKPVNIRILEFVQTACFVVIAGYMLYVSFYDVGDLAGGRRHRSDLEFPSPTPSPANP